MVPQSRIDEFIAKWQGTPRRELKDRISTLKGKPATTAVQAEIKAIEALLR